jgi:hypothetical protein
MLKRCGQAGQRASRTISTILMHFTLRRAAVWRQRVQRSSALRGPRPRFPGVAAFEIDDPSIACVVGKT